MPFLIYCFLYYKSRKEASALDMASPPFISAGLIKAFIQFLIIASISLTIFAFTTLYGEKPGKYIPAKVVDGKMEKGHIENN